MTITMNIALLIFRAVIGLTLAVHGAQKLFGWFGGFGPVWLSQILEKQGYKMIANMGDYSDIYASTVYLFTRKTVTANPKLPEAIVKAQAEAIKRFYDDKAFAVKAYIAYDKQNPADVERIYDMLAKTNQLERVPYVLTAAVKSIMDQANAEAATQLKDFDPHKIIDNGVVDRLVKEGFFEKTFGPGVKSEQEKKSKAAFR